MNPTTLEQSLLDRLKSIGSASGRISLPCVPALSNTYAAYILQLFELLGVKFKADRLSDLNQLLQAKLAEGYAASQHSRIVISYQPAVPPQTGLVLDITVQVDSVKSFYEKTVNDHFSDRLENMETAVFGKHPNAKVIDVATQLAAGSRILDVGAGSGRNTLPLARLGFPVDAIELAEVFSLQLQSLGDREGLPIKVTQADILNPLVRLPFGYYQLAVLAEILPHFRDPDQVRLTLAKMCDAVCSGGLILFNTFITQKDYLPTEAEKQVAQVSQAFFMTETELASALEGLPLDLLSQELVYDYEKQHLPAAAYPPSPWFEQWTMGKLVFEQTEAAIALVWILCRRQ